MTIFDKHSILPVMKQILIFMIGLCMSLTATAQTSTESNSKIYNAKTITLPNAMQVVVVENHRTPAVTHMVWYRLGGADEPMGESGLAHYLEHLMFKGSELVESGEFSKKVKSWGGNDNAFTSWDFTAYFQTIPSDKLESVMLMEADRMKNLNFNDDEALTERDVILQERKQRTDSNPMAQLSESMRAALFINHPYARPIIGWDDELKQLNPDAARAFYKQYYAPRNAILVVSGDVNATDVFERAAMIYGKIDNNDSAERPTWPNVAVPNGNTLITLASADVKQPVWSKLYRVPSMGQDYKKSLTLTLLDEIIGGNTGRLYQSLVVDKKLSSVANFYYSGVSVSDATLSIGVTPLDGIASSQIDTAVLDVLNDVAVNGVTDDELTKAVSKIRDESIYELDSLTGPAMMVGYQLISGLSLDQAETWIHDLDQITTENIQSIVTDYLLPGATHYHAVTGHLIPKDAE